MLFPQVRLQPWYPGQFGVPGADAPLGLRWCSMGYVLYVDTDHPDAADTNDGWDPNAPLATIQQAVDNLNTIQARVDAAGTPHEPAATNSVIVVAPGTYDENVVIDTDDPDYCTIMGGGNGRYPVILDPTSGDAITCDAYGWRFEGLQFQPANGAAGIKLTRVSGAGAEGTVISDCFFNGGWAGTGFGVELNGAPANVSIIGCRFAEFAATGACITVTDTSTADPYQTHIMWCTFQESDEYITRDCAGGWSQTIIAHNIFVDGSHDASYPAGAGGTSIFIDMRGATNGYNRVCQNCLGGDDYAEPGGYYAGTGDVWAGNYHEDTAEGEVGDNGITVSPPAA